MRDKPRDPRQRYESVGGWRQHVLRALDIVGLIRFDDDGKVRWPFRAPPKHERWRSWALVQWNSPWSDRVGLFRNLPGVVKWERGRLLPRRWGFTFFGFEFGDRGD